MIAKLVVIGVGLIGGSLACALRKAGVVGEVVGVGRGLPNLELAVQLGVIDRYSLDAAAEVLDADVVVIGATLGATAKILETIAPFVGAHTIVTDVGSTKASVVAAARAALGDAFSRFVPGHPIAGTEHSGAQAAFAELYCGHRVILTPVDETDPQALARVQTMWESAGARVLAATSHLPHMLAFALVEMLAAADDADDIFAFAAGGFRDFTRIASSSPEMWRDIALANRDALLEICAAYGAQLQRLTEALRARDGEALESSFARAKEARDRCLVPEANARR
jgi:prephenate dehydrogenase